MELWINNVSLHGQSGTLVYRQLRAYLRTCKYTFQHQTGEVGYHSASSYQSQSDHSRSSSPSEPSTSSNGNDRTQCGKEKKMWLKEEVILIETYLKEKR